MYIDLIVINHESLTQIKFDYHAIIFIKITIHNNDIITINGPRGTLGGLTNVDSVLS